MTVVFSSDRHTKQKKIVTKVIGPKVLHGIAPLDKLCCNSNMLVQGWRNGGGGGGGGGD